MTVPPGFKGMPGRVADMVRNMTPFVRGDRLSPDERALGVFLRGNTELLGVLSNIIQSRIEGRANLPVPSDPIDCKAMVDRDSELRWLLRRLEFVHASPVAEPAEDHGEQPA